MVCLDPLAAQQDHADGYYHYPAAASAGDDDDDDDDGDTDDDKNDSTYADVEDSDTVVS